MQLTGWGEGKQHEAYVSPHGLTGKRFLASPIEWFLLLTGLALVVRYRWILDDSTVYFRYVDNLLFLKRGLVYNYGEFVEGFSSPLWVGVLIVCRLTRLDYWTITLALACVSWVLFWLAAVHVNRVLGAQDGKAGVNLPLILLATAYGPLSYFSSGSESPLMQLSAACVALYAINPGSRLWQILLGLMPLVRNEFVIPLLVLIAYRYWVSRRLPWPILGSAATACGAWLGFRVYYYADLFPCPFYLKDKVSISQGLYYLFNGFSPYGIWLLLSFAAIATIWRARSRSPYTLRDTRWLMACVAISGLPYVVKVGGDMMHYRLIAFPFCLLSLSTAGLFERFSLDFNFARSNASRLVLGLALGFVSFLVYPSFLSMHPVFGREERTIDHGISDAPWHRYHPALAFTSERRVEDSKRLAEYAHMKPDHSAASMEVFCATIFSHALIRYVHGYGLTEPILARVNAREQRPGHKADLVPLGSQLASLRTWDSRTQPGIAARAVEARHAPKWVAENLDTISGIENRMYNRHRFVENLRLALENVGRIDM